MHTSFLLLRRYWHLAVEFGVSGWALYAMLLWARRARATRIALVALAAYLAGAVARRVDLPLTSWVLQWTGILLALSVLLIFQTELRSALRSLDAPFTGRTRRTSPGPARRLAEATFELACTGLGALVVVRVRDSLAEAVHGGSVLAAPISAELLLAIFQKASPLHDGAVVIEGDRIQRVNSILPLTRDVFFPARFGTRHRAALGVSELTDARVIVVSEERGEVRLAEHGVMRVIATTAELALAISSQPEPGAGFLRRAAGALVRDLQWKALAAMLAALLVTLPWLHQVSISRTINAPIEFDDIPPHEWVSRQSADHIELELRGPAWVLEGLDPVSVVVRASLAGAREGARTVTVSPDSIQLPPEVALDRMAPTSVTVLLERADQGPVKRH